MSDNWFPETNARKKISWAKEMNIDQKELIRESPDHPRQKQIMRFHEERAIRFENYRRLISLGRYVAAESMYWEDYEKLTREMADYMEKPYPDSIIARNLERGNYE
jgi:hypothetical protein